ncbi:hypothetical protein MTBSS4_50203 [Magnetospirillum sp. SS-4]|nr:hypothetical protein MTBSS4_50203 [Magnetospirillum sp. SS-4]
MHTSCNPADVLGTTARLVEPVALGNGWDGCESTDWPDWPDAARWR